MIAFHILWWPVYRYGIFYGITFVVGYRWLGWIAKLPATKRFPKTAHFLKEHRDDLFLAVILGVMLWGRIGEILLYSPWYYRENPGELLAVRQGGMSFVWGIWGVIIALLIVKRRYMLKWEDMRALGDVVVCIVPLGSLLWRIGNMLNQELYGLPLDKLPNRLATVVNNAHLTYIYDQVDQQVRVNTNLIQSILEWALIRILILILFGTYRKTGKWSAGKLGAMFLVLYACMRFVAEFFKDLPVWEKTPLVSLSQWMMIVLMIIGIYLFRRFSRKGKMVGKYA